MTQPNDAPDRDGTVRDEPVTHELKCWPVYFERILDGSKTFEVRLNDRGFQRGDRVWLREYDPDVESGHYTGRDATATIGYVLSDYCAAIPDFAGHVVFSLLGIDHVEVPF